MRLIALFVLTGILVSCGRGKEATDEPAEMDHRTEVRLRQYMVQGKQLYLTHCANCHQKDGTGLAQLYPPLAKSDYLMDDLKRAACIIQNGIEGEITVSGRTFSQPMPGLAELTPIEVAEILTYVSNSWGNQAGISSTRDVSIWLKKCEK
jgi:mono/diheme cytochrome c family protein